MHMEWLIVQVCNAIESWSAQVLGKALTVRLSDKAMLAAPDYVRGGAEQAKEALAARMEDCTLLGARLMDRVEIENGWLLFTLHRDAFDAYAQRLEANFAPGDTTLDRRMSMLLRHKDAPLPDCPAIQHAVLIASAASERGRWTQEDVRTVLTMTHALSGMERVQAEQNAARAAKIILFERSTMQ